MNQQPETNTALYCRLSIDDARESESNSIANQKAIITKYVQENGFRNTQFFVDDGYSGVLFDRPGLTAMMEGVKNGSIKTIIVKDHSRLGRNRLVVGMLLEEEFERYGVRYIAILDNIDSDKGLSDLVPMQDLFNEWHAKTTSQKIRAVAQSKGNAGLPLSNNPPYGYKKNPDGKHWLVDKPAAAVVERIYALCMAGKGPRQIAEILRKDNILTPGEHWRSIGRKTAAPLPVVPHGWETRTVSDILGRMEYIGHTVNFRTYSKSFKKKKRLKNDPSQWKIFEDTHQPIISIAVWERVQEIRKGRRRRSKTGKVSLFSGLLECADCGKKMYYCASRTYEERQNHFNCGAYRNKRQCSAHYIREAVLHDLVLTHIQRVMAYVKRYEGMFIQNAVQKTAEEQTKAIAAKKKALEQHRKRIAELDLLFQKLFEGNATGRITDERFITMSKAYEAEQAQIKQEAAALEADLAQEKQAAANTERFISIVRRYTEINALTPTILHDFIEKIIIHAPDKSSGKRKQKVEIHYNAIGIIDVPTEDEIAQFLREHQQRRTTEQAAQTAKTKSA